MINFIIAHGQVVVVTLRSYAVKPPMVIAFILIPIGILALCALIVRIAVKPRLSEGNGKDDSEDDRWWAIR